MSNENIEAKMREQTPNEEEWEKEETTADDDVQEEEEDIIANRMIIVEIRTGKKGEAREETRN